jgi:hypothetical protein
MIQVLITSCIMEVISNILAALGIHTLHALSWLVKHIETISELIFGGGIFIYLIDQLRTRSKEHKLIINMKRQIAFELIEAEYALAMSLRELLWARKNGIGFNRFKYSIKLYATNSVVSSGHFLKFDSKFIGYIFNLLTRLEVMETVNDRMVKHKNDKQAMEMRQKDSILKTVYALNSLNKPTIYSELISKFLSERMIMERKPGKRNKKTDGINHEEPIGKDESVHLWRQTIKDVILGRDENV